MELAEQGVAVAQLNAAILFDKYLIIPNSKRLLLSEILARETSNNQEFNINKHLAFKFFSMAVLQKETEDEANLKLGDFYYNG